MMELVETASRHSNSDASWDEDFEGENVKKANQIENPLQAIAAGTEFRCKNGSLAIVKYFKSTDLTLELQAWIVDLFTRNMKSMYRKSAWGWKPKEKKKELMEDEAKYLVVYIQDKPVAFTHFRFDMEFGREVVYCYEVQVEEKGRGMGLGKYLMGLLSKFAALFSLTHVMLTVFTYNTKALEFFVHDGFIEDKYSPSRDEKLKYMIMSKKILQEA